MRRLIEKAVAVLGGIALLLGTSMMPASAAGQVPFHSQWSAVVTFNNPTNPTGGTLSGSGLATQLGASTESGSIAIVGPPLGGCAGGFRVDHVDTYTAANGDRLSVSITNDACPIGTNIYQGVGTYVVTGGTGRFAGATGSGTILGVGNFNTAQLNYTLDGTISTPGN